MESLSLPPGYGRLYATEYRPMTDAPQSERVIELYSTVGTALILDFPTGVRYTNKAGAPVAFNRARKASGATRGINFRDADAIDAMLCKRKLIE